MKEENVNTTPEVNQEPQPSVTPVNTLDQQRIEMEKEMMKENLVPPAEPIMPDAPEIAQPVAQPAAQPAVQPAPVEPQIDPSFGTNVTPPVQPVPEPTKKKSKLPVIIIVLVILAAGGFACWKFVLPMLNKTEGGNETTTTAEAVAEVTELTDVAIKSIIDKAIKIYETDYISLRVNDLYKKENFKLEDKNTKADIILLNTSYVTDDAIINTFNTSNKEYSSTAKLIIGETNITAIKEEYSDSLEFAHIYKPEDIAKLYKEIFNEDFDAKAQGDVGIFAKGDSYEGSCPSFAYDSVNNIYVKLDACGGDDGKALLSYTYKYELETKGEEKKAYAYVAVGQYDEEIFDDNSSYVYYSLIDQTKKDVLTDGEYKIDASNYEKFDKFKYVFIYDKATNNYYVDHIERVK